MPHRRNHTDILSLILPALDDTPGADSITRVSTPICPKCREVITGDDINVANDVAYCRACNLAHKLSALVHGTDLTADVDFHRPPAGITYHNDARGTVVTATHRSLGAAFGTLAIALFWNGIVSVFVLLAVAGTLRHLHVSLPHWFPTPDMNGGPMSVGMTIFLWIFLTPFIVVGLVMIGAFLSSLGGRTEVRIHKADSLVFTGIGPLGYRRRFDAATVKEVRIDDQQWRDSDGDRQRKTAIVIETRTGKLIKFGTTLTEERRKFVAAAVRRALIR